ncbi:MAG: AAA family ATPase [Candidatus Kapabacteria bacterium]|nr:AAA family ATPase [Candidatus Kapabacteria bacterium]
MITRLKVSGFKNLVNVDIHLNAFTCVAGTNAVGKSNLFDAIRFLSNLSHQKIIEAAKSVRSENQKASEIRDIFFKSGDDYYDTISFSVEMIIPNEAIDELGEKAKAAITTVKYDLILKYLKEEDDDERIIIVKEELKPITQTEAKSNLYFLNSIKWKKSVIEGRRPTDLISTENSKIRIHQDGQKGKPYDRIASQLPRTVLSTANAEYPTACVVQQEMKSWMFLQLEPSAMRKSDELDKRKNATLEENGANMPATIFRLQSANPNKDIYQQLSNRLTELIDNVERITIDKDEKRTLLTLLLKFKNSAELPARSLSDGTLRFLALAILEIDDQSGTVICLEEPENGIHPSKIKEIIKLLQDIACDTNIEVDNDNQNRQVIINTHSPIVVEEVPEGSLLMADAIEIFDDDKQKKIKTITFNPLSNTWRMKIPQNNYKSISKGNLKAYLEMDKTEIEYENKTIERKVKHRDELNQESLFE